MNNNRKRLVITKRDKTRKVKMLIVMRMMKKHLNHRNKNQLNKKRSSHLRPRKRLLNLLNNKRKKRNRLSLLMRNLNQRILKMKMMMKKILK